jgi:hypothetical protein
MPKITKMDMGTVQAYLLKECPEYGCKAPKDGSSKAVLSEAYTALIKAMRKKVVSIGTECEFCDAESPDGLEFCPYCGESLVAPAAEKSTALTVPGGDCVQLTVPIADIETRLHLAVRDVMGNAWTCGDLLKKVRDSNGYKPGTWAEWVAKFGISVATAGNLIRVVEAYPDPAKLAGLTLDKAYIISSVPEAHRAEIETMAAKATGRELAAAAREVKGSSPKRKEASARAHAGKATKKAEKVHEPDLVRKAPATKKVETAPESPLFTCKLGDKLNAPFVDSDGKKCQISEAAKRKATATFVLGRNLRLIVTISGDKAHGELVK